MFHHAEDMNKGVCKILAERILPPPLDEEKSLQLEMMERRVHQHIRPTLLSPPRKSGTIDHKYSPSYYTPKTASLLILDA